LPQRSQTRTSSTASKEVLDHGTREATER
jgi:hypothetical protein